MAFLKFVDIDLNTLNYNIKALKDAVTDETRAIMVVNLLGNPNDFSAINAEILRSKRFLFLRQRLGKMRPN